MKITKYNQSCLLIETNNKRVLIDPGSIGIAENDYINTDWINIDAILVTHKHFDHCHVGTLNVLNEREKTPTYTTQEVLDCHKIQNCIIVGENETFYIGDIKIEVTKAIYGYLTGMRENDKEILENVGFIIDDGGTRLYTTSDTINFYNKYKCDVLCMPFNGNGLTLGIRDGTMFAKDINPKLLLPIHMQHPISEMNPNIDILKESLEKADINYKILGIGECIEV